MDITHCKKICNLFRLSPLGFFIHAGLVLLTILGTSMDTFSIFPSLSFFLFGSSIHSFGAKP